MNIYKALDSVFPCGKDRSFGEVVNTQISFVVDGKVLDRTIWYKRKAWYVNASVNAFHMHRGIVREFCVDIQHKIPKAQVEACKRLIALAVLNSYLANYKTGEQGFEYSIEVRTNSPYLNNQPACWWVVNAQALDYREVCDDRHNSLAVIVFKALQSMMRKYPAVTDSLAGSVTWDDGNVTEIHWAD